VGPELSTQSADHSSGRVAIEAASFKSGQQIDWQSPMLAGCCNKKNRPIVLVYDHLLERQSSMQKAKPAPVAVRVQSVYVIDGAGEPVVPRGSKVRVNISVMSGSEIGSPKVHGPASVVVRNDITRLIDGHMPIGAMEVEFELTTTGGGKVTFEVPVTFPGSSEPNVQEVTFLVE
jgi:hypothetical protein